MAKKYSSLAVIALALLAIVLNLPYLTGSFNLDDFIVLNGLTQQDYSFFTWCGVWSTDNVPSFDNIWWEGPNWRVSFYRPLPILVFEGSIRLFGEHPFPLHLISLLLHAGIVVGLYSLVRKLTGRPGLALLTGLFFVTCEDLSISVGWISTATDLWAVLFIILALLGHVHWLQRRKYPALIGSMLALILALGCKETAVVAPVAILLLTLFMPAGTDNDTTDPKGFRYRITQIIKDPLSWLPSLVILIVYLAVYKGLNLGAMNNLGYVNPLSDPGKYLAHAMLHLPIFWLATFSSIPPFLTAYFPATLMPMAILGVGAFTMWLIALWPFRRHSLVRWALIVYLLALLPQVCPDASERGLYFPMITASILLALVACTIGPLARRMVPRPPIGTRWTRFVGWFAVVGILFTGTLFSALRPWALVPAMAKPEQQIRTAIPAIEQYRPEHVVLLNASDIMVTPYPYDIIDLFSSHVPGVWLLSAAHGVFTLERTGDSSFVVRTDRAGWTDNAVARIFRTQPVLKPGYRYEKTIFTATIIETTAEGSDALAVRFDMVQPLDYPGWLFLRWNGQSYEPLDIAALKVGESVLLADTSDPWEVIK